MTKVLVIVEDDSGMRELIRLKLSNDPRLELIGEAATADEAVEMAREHQPDLVILDHFIEGEVMGIQAAPMIKAAAPGCRILLFTSHDLELEAGREIAVDRYLHKDNLSRLLETVQAMLAIEAA